MKFFPWPRYKQKNWHQRAGKIAARRSPTVKAFLERVQRGDPERKKKAVVATAHYLVRVMWAMLKHGTLWRETESVQAA